MSGVPETILAARLLAHSGVAALTTTIRPVMLAPNDSMPAVVYQRTATEFENYSTGADTTAHATVDVTSLETDYSDAKALAKQVRLALSGWADGNGDIWHLQDESDQAVGPENGEEGPLVYQVVQSYRVSYTLETS